MTSRRRRGAGGGGVPLTAISQKGYGIVEMSDGTVTTLEYGTVQGGSAPAAGDFVIWIASGSDATFSNINQFVLPEGWVSQTIGPVGSNSFQAVFSKVLTAEDISSPPAVTTIESNTHLVWVAYDITGDISDITIEHLTGSSVSGTPPNQTVLGSGMSSPLVILGMALNASSTVSLNWSGATPDGSASLSGEDFGEGSWKLYGLSTTTGDDITMSNPGALAIDRILAAAVSFS